MHDTLQEPNLLVSCIKRRPGHFADLCFCSWCLSLQALEIIPAKFYFVYVRRLEAARLSPTAKNHICFCVDNELVSLSSGSQCTKMLMLWQLVTVGFTPELTPLLQTCLPTAFKSGPCSHNSLYI